MNVWYTTCPTHTNHDRLQICLYFFWSTIICMYLPWFGQRNFIFFFLTMVLYTELSRENHPNFCATRKQEFSKSCRYLHVYVSRRFCCLSCGQIPFFIPTMYSLFPFKAIQFHLVSEIVPLYLSSRYGHSISMWMAKSTSQFLQSFFKRMSCVSFSFNVIPNISYTATFLYQSLPPFCALRRTYIHRRPTSNLIYFSISLGFDNESCLRTYILIWNFIRVLQNRAIQVLPMM